MGHVCSPIQLPVIRLPMDWLNITCLVLAFYFGSVLKGATGAGAPIITIPITYSSMMGPQPSQPSLFPIFIQYLAKLEVSQSPNHRQVCFGLLGATIAITGLAYLAPSLLSLTSSAIVVAYLIFRRLKPDWILQISAVLWAVGWLCQWYTARCCGYFHPCIHHIFGCDKITQIDLHCCGLNIFCWHVCDANPNARQL